MKKNFIKQSFNDISKLKGFLNFESYQLFFVLQKIVESKSPILEIGVFCGKSLLGLAMAFKNRVVWGVDPFYENFFQSLAAGYEAEMLINKSDDIGPSDRINKIHQIRKLLQRKYDYPKDSEIILKRKTQAEFLQQNHPVFSVCHVDGEHTAKAINEVLDSLKEILEPGGWLIVDDLFNNEFPMIAEAIYGHSNFKKEYFPVLVGFNKGLFLYNPAPEKLEEATAHFQLYYEKQGSYHIRSYNDKSLSIKRNYQSNIIWLISNKIKEIFFPNV
jgi:hypothetical protein